MYSIKWRKKSLNELRKLPKEVARRVVKKVDVAKLDPKHYLEKLTDDPGYKLRIGEYRAIIDILEDEKVLAVRVIGHRRNVYKRNL